MKTFWVIFWKYSDGSGCGVVRGYENAEEAQDDMKLLQEQCEGVRQFTLCEAPFRGRFILIGGGTKPRHQLPLCPPNRWAGRPVDERPG